MTQELPDPPRPTGLLVLLGAPIGAPADAPPRLAEWLADLAAAFGAGRSAAVCRELTKTYEEVRRGGLAELAQWALGEVRGEITVVVAGAQAAAAEALPPEALASIVAER